ncbi:hypothetical protein [Rhodopirellula sp. MGV]|uniref:hypothetical protein n=1 Tax=Rhodopirellula sp. MGV TaxID=2023130 RepID=UPI000B968B65|nr:hypothetical protein [Rhodopirellula sp. MGV]OYP37333.1 hypothetical protein CGZ80_05520 [Rhodopirellula sp. MGV]PNY36422.1 hypothetical protein C2E31_13400 [Rhodopirellula baltica]
MNLGILGKTSLLVALPNRLSLDAVTVGLAWNTVITNEFTGRLPAWHELLIIGTSIWIVYTIDRLLDGRTLSEDTPATDRHQFHSRHSSKLLMAWLTAVAVVAWCSAYHATETQLRWGIVTVGLAICYVVSAQLLNPIKTLFPKEVRAGALFALGVSLVAWSDHRTTAWQPLLLITILCAAMFTINCLIVSASESEIDVGQGNDSLARRHPKLTERFILMIALHTAVTIIAMTTAQIPMTIGLCILTSDALLVSYVILEQRRSVRKLSPSAWMASLADAAIAVAPLTCIALLQR